MDFCCADVKSEGFDLYGFDVVYLAALVGSNDGEKQEVIATVTKRMRPEALLVLRSAHSLRSLMYPVRSHQ
jgi:nicotianamine synthase